MAKRLLARNRCWSANTECLLGCSVPREALNVHSRDAVRDSVPKAEIAVSDRGSRECRTRNLPSSWFGWHLDGGPQRPSAPKQCSHCPASQAGKNLLHH